MVKAGSVVAVLGLALLVGGMVFFGAVVAPLVFTRLPAAESGPFIRVLFPYYFGFVAVGAGISVLGFLGRRERVSAGVMGVVLAEALWAWFWLIPHLNGWREAGDVFAFDWGHRISTWLNFLEILTAGWLLARLVVGYDGSRQAARG